jgi:adenylylsulfate kinase-like enzyme
MTVNQIVKPELPEISAACRHIFLTGFMGSGKTTIGKKIVTRKSRNRPIAVFLIYSSMRVNRNSESMNSKS